jgi:hypothetical protein
MMVLRKNYEKNIKIKECIIAISERTCVKEQLAFL